jgi:integrase
MAQKPNDLVQAFASWLSREGKAPATTAKYRAIIADYLGWLGRDPVLARKRDIREYVDAWRDKTNPSPATVRLRVAALKSFYRYLDDLDLMEDEEGREIPSPVRYKLPSLAPRAIDYLSEEEDRALLKAPITPQERMLVFLLRWSGMRIAEACSLRISDVDLARGEIRVRKSKTASGLRMIPISPELRLELQRWIAHLHERDLYHERGPLLATRNRDELGIPTATKPQHAWRVLKRVANRAGVRPTEGKGANLSAISAHTLRRTLATYCLNRGMSMESLSKILGHSDVKVTSVSYAEMLNATVQREFLAALAG